MLEKRHSEKRSSTKLRRSERLQKRKKITLIVTFLGALLLGAYSYLDGHEVSRYKDIHIEGPALQEKVEKVTHEALAGTTFYFLANASILTPSLSSLTKKIVQSIPEIETVQVKKLYLTKGLDVTYTLKTPVFKMSDDIYVDIHNLHYHDDRSPELPLLTSQKEINAEELRKLIFLKNTFDEALFPVLFVEVDSAGDAVFTLKTNAKTQVKVSLLQNEKEVWSKIVSALETAPLKENRESFGDVSYLDARFGNKIYYKMTLKDGGIMPTSTATTTYERQ